MYIAWYGLSCLKIESKIDQNESVILTDPFDHKKTGLKLPRVFHADLLLQSKKDPETVGDILEKEKGVFLINEPGEYEKSGIFVKSFKINHGLELIFTIETEGLRLLFCGGLPRLPDEGELKDIEDIDILFVPVGGHGVLSSKDAAELVLRIEPRVVIPIYYKLPGLKISLDEAVPFLKAAGAKSLEAQTRLRLVKKDLPQEETQVFLLAPPN